jgi:twitching motility protein PilT
MPELDALLHAMLDRKASDLHLTSSLPPYIREHGDMKPLEGLPPLSTEDYRRLLAEIMPADNAREFAERWDTDFAYALPDGTRFRVNVFVDSRGIGAVLRQIPSKVPTADQLNLPKAVRDLCYHTKGLIVVTGPTGSGKSTTLAAMIDLINKTRAAHIITIEDPIEFVHPPQKCLINQRQIHKHTQSFANALRAALREDPDIVLVGEMRDLETMEIAIETAETGHLVFGTLHTNTAPSTVDRIIDKFPAARQNQIRAMLADSLRGVVAQTLCKRKSGGRVAALEILLVTPAVASNIREGKTHYIDSAMQTGRNLGMQRMDDTLLKLVTDGLISAEEAYLKALDKEAFEKRLREAGVAREEVQVEAAPTEAELRAARDVERVREYKLLLDREPIRLEALNNLAWILATNPNPQIRNGAEAMRLAERAQSLAKGEEVISVLDTLSAAYAEVGDFTRAEATARRGMEMAQAAGRTQAARLIEKQLRFYEQRRPMRDE